MSKASKKKVNVTINIENLVGSIEVKGTTDFKQVEKEVSNAILRVLKSATQAASQ